MVIGTNNIKLTRTHIKKQTLVETTYIKALQIMFFLAMTNKCWALSALIIVSLSLSACDFAEGYIINPKANEPKHDHGILDVESINENAVPPTIEVLVEPDSMTGWNVKIITSGFTFTPDLVGDDPEIGEGHAHIYVDGYKFARVYSDWFHLKNLTPGKHDVRVTLNANDHSTWSTNGNEISDTVTIEQTQ